MFRLAVIGSEGDDIPYAINGIKENIIIDY